MSLHVQVSTLSAHQLRVNVSTTHHHQQVHSNNLPVRQNDNWFKAYAHSDVSSVYTVYISLSIAMTISC